ncbi:MAG: YciI family protein [Pseudomonadota bacterium]
MFRPIAQDAPRQRDDAEGKYIRNDFQSRISRLLGERSYDAPADRIDAGEALALRAGNDGSDPFENSVRGGAGMSGSGIEKQIARATSSLLGLRFWLIHYSEPSHIDALAPYLDDHFRYVKELENKDLLFAAGAIRTPEGELKGRSLFVIRAEDHAAAERIAAADPMVRAGVRSFSVEQWTVNMGSFEIRLAYSDQSFSVKGAGA